MTEFLLHQRTGPRRGYKVNPSAPSYSGKGLVPGKGGIVRAAGLREGRGPSGGPRPPPPPRLPARGSCAARVEHSRYPPTLCPWRARPAPTSVMPPSCLDRPAQARQRGERRIFIPLSGQIRLPRRSLRSLLAASVPVVIAISLWSSV